MPDEIDVDLFVEDRAHEAFLTPMIRRIAASHHLNPGITIRSARGGHPRALSELFLYRRSYERGAIRRPDSLVVAIDANCKGLGAAKQEIVERLGPELAGLSVVACPDPHIERWFLADMESFGDIVGAAARITRKKCERAYYKQALAEAVVRGGNPATLGGIEFADEIVGAMNLYRAGRADRSLQHFVADLEANILAVVRQKRG